jgi:hypothetical protein
MNSFFRSIVLAGGILLLAGVHNVSAQIEPSIEFTTPFAFTIGNTTLPAGSYTIAPVEDDEPQVLELKGAHASVVFLTDNAQLPVTPSKTEVVFNRYGDQYVLKNIWLQGSDVGYATTNALGEGHIARHGGSPSESRVAAQKGANSSK